MASTAIRAPTCLCSSAPSSTTKLRPTIFNNLSSSLTFHSITPRLDLYALGLRPHFSPWCGLKHLGLSVTWRSPKLGNKNGRERVVQASLFGVGAPEALVIGVVALLVFGPKGLAEVARSLGKTLRAFQPTIRELQEVSREFKSTLEKEIGLDEISASTTTTQRYNATTTTSAASPISNPTEPKIATDPNGTSSPDGALTTDELLKATEEKLKALASKQEELSSQSQLEAQAKPQDIESLSNETKTEEAEQNVGSFEVKENGQFSSQASTTKENAG